MHDASSRAAAILRAAGFGIDRGREGGFATVGEVAFEDDLRAVVSAIPPYESRVDTSSASSLLFMLVRLRASWSASTPSERMLALANASL